MAYIDLMKGICIFLIMIHHSGLLPEEGLFACMLDNVRIPLYFFLAGLFIRPERHPALFVASKIDRLLIPYLFFNLLWIAAEWVIAADTGQTLLSRGDWVYALGQGANSPTWFLKALFWSYMAYYLISRGIRPLWGQAAAAAAGAALGVWWGVAGIDLGNTYMNFLQIPNGLVGLPFLFVGNKVSTRMLGYRPGLGRRILWLLPLLGAWALCSQGFNRYVEFAWGNNPLLFYAAAFSGIGVIWLLASYFDHIPYFSLIGRYSIIVLGTHYIMLLVFSTWAPGRTWLATFTMLLMCPVFIDALRAAAPHLTAQKDVLSGAVSRRLSRQAAPPARRCEPR